MVKMYARCLRVWVTLGLMSGVLGFDVRRHLSTKTPYVWRRKMTGPALRGVAEAPQFVYHIARHGLRWPTDGSVENLRTLEAAFQRCGVSDGVMTSLRELLVEDSAGDLHKEGQFELYAAGQRLRDAFPELFRPLLNSRDYYFRSTAKPRAGASAVAFGMGLFPDVCRGDVCLPQAVSVAQLPKHADPLLRFFDIDPVYDDQIDDLKDQMADEVAQAIYPSLGRVLDLKNGMGIFEADPSLVGALWEGCQMEAGLKLGSSLCQMLTKEAVLVLEWVSDLKSVLKSGMHDQLNCCLAQPLLSDIHTNLQEAAEGKLKDGRRARLHFSHAETVLPLACLLGLDAKRAPQHTLFRLLNPFPEAQSAILAYPLLHSYAHSLIWYTSQLAPLAANVLVALYTEDTPLVRLYWNEQLISGPWCGGASECSLDAFIQHSQQNAAGLGNCHCAGTIEATCAMPEPVV